MKKTLITICIAISINSAKAQDFDLPDINNLIESVEDYYKELSNSQTKENEETTKMRWLNYIPSPSYSPFTGGFGATLNLSAPIQEVNARRTRRLKNASIKKLNKLQSEELKNQIKYQYQTIKITIEEYYQHKIVDSLRKKSFILSEKFYSKNQITPSEFLQIQQGFELYKLSRIVEANNIKKSIIQVCINAKKAATANSDFSVKTSR